MVEERPTEDDSTVESNTGNNTENLSSFIQSEIASRLGDPGTHDQQVAAFQGQVASFASEYSQLIEQGGAKAQQGRRLIIDAILSPNTPFTLQTLRNYQYDGDALFYRDLLADAGSLTEEDPDFARQASVTGFGWRRRHDDTNSAIDDMQTYHPNLAEHPAQQSSLEYELAQAFKKKGDTTEASRWLTMSGKSSESAGDVRKGRMTRAEAIRWLEQEDPGSQEAEILAVRAEFAARVAAADDFEEVDEAARWVFNTHTWFAETAAKLNDADMLAANLAVIDTTENITEKKWMPEDVVKELRDALIQLRGETE
jgi:hypothetical protein